MATNIVTTADLDPLEFGCKAGKIAIQWDAIPCSVVTDCSDASDQGSLSYNGATGELTHTNSNGTTQTVNLPLENFLSNASFDDPTNILTLTLVDGTTFNVDMTDLVDVYALQVTDSNCIDLTLTGDGSALNPWNISAAPILDPSVDNALSCTAAGLFGAATVVQVSDTDCIDMTITGAGTVSSPYVISAAPIVDAVNPQNVLQCGINGLVVDVEAWVAAEPFDCSGLPLLP